MTSNKIASETTISNKSLHPSTAEMVNSAMAARIKKKGSSLQAIKKYIAGQYVYLKHLKSVLEKKRIIQTSGSGASGRFMLASNIEKKTGKKRAIKKISNSSVIQKTGPTAITINKSRAPKPKRFKAVQPAHQ